MERLTGNYDYCFLICYEQEGDLYGEECPWYKKCYERQIFEKLKHYEDLEEQDYKMVNIDKIVEQLEELEKEHDCIDRVIGIVKGGGTDG